MKRQTTQSNTNKSFVAPMFSETKPRRIKIKWLSSISNSVSSIEAVNMLGSCGYARELTSVSTVKKTSLQMIGKIIIFATDLILSSIENPGSTR